MKLNHYRSTLWMALLAAVTLGAINIKARAAEYFDLDYNPTTEWIDVYSPNSPCIDPNDDIGAFVDSGDPNIGKICVGVRDPEDKKSGMYGFLPVYRDDSRTPDIKDGANDEDEVKFLVWKDSERELYYGETEPNQVIYGPNSPRRVDLSLGEVFPYGWEDLAVFRDNWLATDCSESNNYCNECDKIIGGGRDGIVNFRDLAYIGNHWGPAKLEEWWYGN